MWIIYSFPDKMDIVKNEFLRPTLKLDDQKFEFIFVLDISWSMSSGKLGSAKRALNVSLVSSFNYFHHLSIN